MGVGKNIPDLVMQLGPSWISNKEVRKGTGWSVKGETVVVTQQ